MPSAFGGGSARLNNPWTDALGKTCPGPGKIVEFPRLLQAVQGRLKRSSEPIDKAKGNGTQSTTTVLPGEGWMAISRRTLADERRWKETSALNGGRALHPGDVVLIPAA